MAEPVASWRIALVADGASQAAYAAALEDFAESISAFETAPNGPWTIEALTTREPDRAAVEDRLARAAASFGATAPNVTIERLPEIDWLAENRRGVSPPRRRPL